MDTVERVVLPRKRAIRGQVRLAERKAAALLRPGEKAHAVVLARKNVTPLAMFFGGLVYQFLQKPVYVVATDQRILVFKGPSFGRRIRDLAFEAELDLIRLEGFRRYVGEDRFTLREPGTGFETKLKSKRRYRPEVDALVALLAP